MNFTVDLKSFRSDERMALTLRSIYESYGYRPYKMSKFEEYELYSSNIDFLGDGGVLTFTDVNGKLMALKPDVTLSIVKNSKGNTGTQKVHYRENVYRRNARGGSFKEMLQSGIECIGDIDIVETTEVLILALKSLTATDRSYRLDISHMGVLSTLIGDEVPVEIRDELFTCIKRKNVCGIIELGMANSLDNDRINALAYAVSLNGDAFEILASLKNIRYLNDCRSLNELEEIVTVLCSLGYKDNIGIDLSVVNDMNYYRSLIFRGYIDCIPEAILFGGRYDDLVKKMGRDCGALGFAVALDRLQDLTKEDRDGASVLLVYSDDVPVAEIIAVSDKLRDDGYSVELSSSVKKAREFTKIFYITPSGITEDTNA